MNQTTFGIFWCDAKCYIRRRGSERMLVADLGILQRTLEEILQHIGSDKILTGTRYSKCSNLNLHTSKLRKYVDKPPAVFTLMAISSTG